MELKLNLGLNQIVGIIKQLPRAQKELIKKEIDKDLSKNSMPEKKQYLTQYLLNGPVMNDDEETRFAEFNKEFEKWTKKLFS